MTALQFYRSPARFVAAKAIGGRAPGLLSGPLAPLRVLDDDDVRLPGPGWVRVAPRLSGICGSDLAMLSGKTSFYFDPLVSMPFVPGHEIVGDVVDDVPGLAPGARVVVDPVLACAARGLPACPACAEGKTERCERVVTGHVAPGLQTGYCADTGGGWSGRFVAHLSQLHAVPEAMADERAVMIEPLACAIHAALRAEVEPGASVLIVGSGTVGILTVLALRRLTEVGSVTVVAKHGAQRSMALDFGADHTVEPAGALAAVRRAARAFALTPMRGEPFLLGGVDVAFDCAGARGSLDLALRATRAGGRVVLAGMPPKGADLSPVWFRELDLRGAYASGRERFDGRDAHAFEIAAEIAGDVPLERLVSATYPLDRWRSALEHALSAGRLGGIKVAFDLRRGV